MKSMTPWEDESGVRVLRLYKSKEHPEWSQPVNKSDLCPDWPRVVLLDLAAEQFEEFHKDALAFAEKYNLFPEDEKISWISHPAMPPSGKDIPCATDGSRWIGVLIHTPQTIAVGAACPSSTAKRKRSKTR
jgi:hypothetical protein